MHHSEDRNSWPYPAMVPYSVKAYPIVQVAKTMGPQCPSNWPPLLNKNAQQWATDVGMPPGLNQLYIHIPFCPFLCHFCPLYKSPVTGSRANDLKTAYLQRLKQEIRMYAQSFSELTFHSIYFGGGTPTELTPEQLGGLLHEIKSSYRVSEHAEITLEGVARQMLAPGYIQECLDLGFNRVSFGVQSTDEVLRKRIGRGDNPNDYPALINLLRKCAPNVGINVDLLACLPEQTLKSLQNDVSAVNSWGVDSIDVLYFVMLPGTRLRNLVKLGERAAPEYGEHIVRAREFVNSYLQEQGFSQITGEVFVRNDEDKFARSSYGGGGTFLNTVLALGPSAFGVVGGAVYQNVSDLLKYTTSIDEGLFPIQRSHLFSKEAAQRRALIMSVMTLQIPKYLLQDPRSAKLIRMWQQAGLIIDDGSVFSLTELGRIWYNHMQLDILPFSELIKALRMFGSVSEQEMALVKSPHHLAGFERELLNLVATRKNPKLRLLAYKALLKFHHLPGIDDRAIGFTGTIDS